MIHLKDLKHNTLKKEGGSYIKKYKLIHKTLESHFVSELNKTVKQGWHPLIYTFKSTGAKNTLNFSILLEKNVRKKGD